MKRNRRNLGFVAALLASWVLPAAAAALEDEIAKLIVEAKAPARFADCKPNLVLTADGKDKFVIRDGADGGKLVAKVGGSIELFVQDPARANAEGTGFKGNNVGIGIPPFFPKARRTVAFETGGNADEAVIRRVVTWKGSGELADLVASDTMKLTFTVHPVLGYHCAIEREIVANQAFELFDKEGAPLVDKQGKPVREFGLALMFGRGIASAWPSRWNYDYTVYTPAAKDRWFPGQRFAGFANNLLSADPADGIALREGGFIAFLPGDDGWGLAFTRTGAPVITQGSCNMWFDQHNHITLPEAPAADGKWRIALPSRFCFLPPEVCKLIQGELHVLFANRKGLLVHLGVVEDFEDQPVSFGDRRRGLLPTQIALVEDKAHSGRKSIRVKSVSPEKLAAEKVTQQPGLPCAGVRSSSRFGPGCKLSCWINVEGDGAEAFISVGVPSLDAAAIGQTRSVAVKAGAGWQQVEFSPQPLKKGMLQLYFICTGTGQAWFDDLHFQDAPKSKVPSDDGTLAPAPAP